MLLPRPPQHCPHTSSRERALIVRLPWASVLAAALSGGRARCATADALPGRCDRLASVLLIVVSRISLGSVLHRSTHCTPRYDGNATTRHRVATNTPRDDAARCDDDAAGEWRWKRESAAPAGWQRRPVGSSCHRPRPRAREGSGGGARRRGRCQRRGRRRRGRRGRCDGSVFSRRRRRRRWCCPRRPFFPLFGTHPLSSGSSGRRGCDRPTHCDRRPHRRPAVVVAAAFFGSGLWRSSLRHRRARISRRCSGARRARACRGCRRRRRRRRRHERRCERP